MFGIVWFHLEHIAFRTVAYAGLPIFLLLSFAVAERHEAAGAFMPFAKKKFDRLIVPWVVWSLAYAAPKLVKVFIRRAHFSDVFDYSMLLSGTRAHLWYLPFVFVMSLGIYLIHTAAQNVRPTAIIVTGLAVGCIAIVASSAALGKYAGVGSPFGEWIFAAPAVALGFAFGRIQWGRFVGNKRAVFACTGVILTALFLLLYAAGLDKLAVPYGIGIVLVCMSFIWPGNGSRFLVQWAPLTFGIYLIHPMLGSVVDAKAPFDSIELKALLTFALSIAAVYGISKTPAKRFI
jgi:fucose 4-O-acetylase-like acetyltransferase